MWQRRRARRLRGVAGLRQPGLLRLAVRVRDAGVRVGPAAGRRSLPAAERDPQERHRRAGRPHGGRRDARQLPSSHRDVGRPRGRRERTPRGGPQQPQRHLATAVVSAT